MPSEAFSATSQGQRQGQRLPQSKQAANRPPVKAPESWPGCACKTVPPRSSSMCFSTPAGTAQSSHGMHATPATSSRARTSKAERVATRTGCAKLTALGLYGGRDLKGGPNVLLVSAPVPEVPLGPLGELGLTSSSSKDVADCRESALSARCLSSGRPCISSSKSLSRITSSVLPHHGEPDGHCILPSISSSRVCGPLCST
mmetsp:Transcript_52777/g.171709  ORF Transcript_52777/g.171709 Transcript_52777/m.171709 type:complete len:201 (+) Transcript_52777:1108-1710(+)